MSKAFSILKMKNTFLICLMILSTALSCTSIIYAIRGPKYEGKYDPSSYPKELDATMYYYRNYFLGEKNIFIYLKFNNDGTFYEYATFNERVSPSELDSQEPHSNFFIYKNGYLRWEIYHDSYNGYILYKAKVAGDSIVAWDLFSRNNSVTYFKLK